MSLSLVRIMRSRCKFTFIRDFVPQACGTTSSSSFGYELSYDQCSLRIRKHIYMVYRFLDNTCPGVRRSVVDKCIILDDILMAKVNARGVKALTLSKELLIRWHHQPLGRHHVAAPAPGFSISNYSSDEWLFLSDSCQCAQTSL